MTEQSMYVPYSEATQASVWVVDNHLQMFTNIQEELASSKAEFELGHIFFFAELTTDNATDEVTHSAHYRDAISGKFVTEDEAESHPDTTVREENG
jgi:hypothetical protein